MPHTLQLPLPDAGRGDSEESEDKALDELAQSAGILGPAIVAVSSAGDARVLKAGLYGGGWALASGPAIVASPAPVADELCISRAAGS